TEPGRAVPELLVASPRLGTPGASGHSTPGTAAWPEGLTHYGLSRAEADASYRASLAEDYGREAGIWMEPASDEHIVVHSGGAFGAGGVMVDPEFACRPWRLVEHYHPGDDLGARFASAQDFEALLYPQLAELEPAGPVTTQIRWRDPQSHLEFITEIGYDPG